MFVSCSTSCDEGVEELEKKDAELPLQQKLMPLLARTYAHRDFAKHYDFSATKSANW